MRLLLLVIALNVLLLVSGYHVLINEERERVFIPVKAGRMVYVPPVELGTQLKCTYFTGRSIRTSEARISADQECPFLLRLY